MFAIIYAVLGFVIVILAAINNKPEGILFGLFFVVCAEIRNVFNLINRQKNE